MIHSPNSPWPRPERPWHLEAGATPLPNGGVRFRVWAPYAQDLRVKVISSTKVVAKEISMNPLALGFFEAIVEGISAGDCYFYVLDGIKEKPDPASRFQPEGIHGPSQVIDTSSFLWRDVDWKGIPLKELIVYELHVGTFTREGTFAAIIPHLEYLKDELGITALELMPVAQFPGGRNWGYDGVYPYAPQSTYGEPLGLMELVNSCHEKGLAVILDVVYNHLGPEGNSLVDFGPYFTDRYKTPWGSAINYDGPESDQVRRYFIENALYWITEYHIDALRLDAIHGIFDFSPKHILQELAEWVYAQAEALGRGVLLIAESDLNDARVIRPVEVCGYGLDAQWNDDFHHALHALFTRERQGYYQDFGNLSQIVKAFEEGFVYGGQYSAFRRRRHGESSKDRPAWQFVIFCQNHDQVGNRALGDRLTALIPFETLKLAAGLVLFSPNIPLLFMGEEYGETAPFLYFTSHSDPGLAEAVRKGRQREFAGFQWGETIPDPQDAMTFKRSCVDLSLRLKGANRSLLKCYIDMVRLRKSHPALNNCNKNCLRITNFDREQSLLIHRWETGVEQVLIICVFNRTSVKLRLMIPEGRWSRIFDSTLPEYGGSGGPNSPHEIEVRGTQPVEISRPSYSLIIYCQGKKT